MKKKKIVRRRPLRISEFRSKLKCDDGSTIDLAKIEKVFPEKLKRQEYLKALYEGLS